MTALFSQYFFKLLNEIAAFFCYFKSKKNKRNLPNLNSAWTPLNQAESAMMMVSPEYLKWKSVTGTGTVQPGAVLIILLFRPCYAKPKLCKLHLIWWPARVHWLNPHMVTNTWCAGGGRRQTAALTDGDRDDWQQQSRLWCHLTEQTGWRGARRDEAPSAAGIIWTTLAFSNQKQSLINPNV